MMGYTCYYAATNKQELINNSYNGRQEIFAAQNTRGSIYAAGGQVLAETQTDADGGEKRVYPYENLFAHAVGYASNGRFGIEASANYYLINSNARLADKVASDVAGAKYPGDSVVTTLDVSLQDIASRSLGVYKGAIIVSEPATGRILAMVSKPDYDPNEIDAIWDEVIQDKESTVLLNRVTQGLYPPGSTFKIITAAAGLEQGVITPQSQFSCPGFIMVEDRKIRCHKVGGHGGQDFIHCMMNSCNPALISVGLLLGVDTYYDYFSRFGLLTKTGVDLPGEAGTIMHNKENMGLVELATVSFGQSFQITPIQLVTTASSIINGGRRVTPHFGVKVVDAQGNMVESFSYPVTGNIVSEGTSATMREILEMVVKEGSGKNGKVEGYRVGGKTATSQTLPRGSGRYISSFIGFAPADNPQVIAVAIVNTPQGVYYGGQVAAPIIRQLFENILPYMGIEQTPPENES